ncbi:MAG: hypothetical protein HYU51_01840 [Candidatus Rokubacteria bacterium]|nr:hypothetical protein [Candidatus Rokubacteria bacterium]
MMSSPPLGRRQFLTLPLALLLAPWGAVAAETVTRRGLYAVDVGILYGLLTFRLNGTIDESLDRDAGRYEVSAVGEGSGIANRVDSNGRLAGGRWAPLRTTSWFQVRGRESRSDVIYDYAHRTIEYHFRGETFFLRRVRIVDDRLPIPDGVHVDDVLSAFFNLVGGDWTPRADGVHQTWVVRRRKRDAEGPDDVDPQPRAELAPLELKLETDATIGKRVASFDMTRFSSWARQDRPARIVFRDDGRPETITSSMILGSSVTIRLEDA